MSRKKLKPTIKIKKALIITMIVALAIEGVIFFHMTSNSSAQQMEKAENNDINKDYVNSTERTITKQNQEVLQFQTRCKINTLPVKKGDKVYTDQTKTRFVTFTLGKTLEITAKAYQ